MLLSSHRSSLRKEGLGYNQVEVKANKVKKEKQYK